jgi:hypothetical protein
MLSEDLTPEEGAAEALIAFGLARTTARRLVGLIHVTPDVVTRWLAYCRLRGPESFRNANVFLLTHLDRNDRPAPSWGALRKLAVRLDKPMPSEEWQSEAS